VDLVVYAVLGLSVTWVLYFVYMQVATRAAEGRPANPLYPLFPALQTNEIKSLVYCFSPQCGPCRPMTREVDKLTRAGLPVYRFDITQHPEVARELGVRATPTLIVIDQGQIGRMILGAKTADAMRLMLDN
jgi:thiol-disulfide isomerase/thioredoxin